MERPDYLSGWVVLSYPGVIQIILRGTLLQRAASPPKCADYDNGWCNARSAYAKGLWIADDLYPNAISAGENSHIIFGNRYDYYTFDTPTPSGDIVSVAVWAEVRGKCALSLNLVYGDDTSEMHQYEWESLVYTEKPAGGAWAWSDLASGTLKAGVKCYRIADKFESGTCRRLKVVITTTTGEITLWPTGDYVPDYIYQLQPVCGNYLEDLTKGQELADSLCDDSVIPPALFRSGIDAITTDPCITSDLSEVAPRFSVINSVKVSIMYACNDADGSAGYIRPFLEIDGTKYLWRLQSLDSPEYYAERRIRVHLEHQPGHVCCMGL